MKILQNIILLLTIFAIISSCAGQGNTVTKNRDSVREKLGVVVSELAPNSHLLYQDKKHNYWIGSDAGTYSYDGEELLLFTKKDGLISNRILGVQEDKFGNIYFDTPDGVSQYNGQEFKTLKATEDHPKKNIWKSEPDDLWFRIGWDTNGPYKFDGEHLYLVEFPKSKIEDEFYAKYPNISYNPYSIYSMFKDSKGSQWFGTTNLGIYQFDGNQIRWMHEEHLGTTLGGGDFGIRSIVEDKDGYIWICNNSYKFKILEDEEANDEQLKSLIYKREKGVDTQGDEVLYFMSMLLDDRGNLWMLNGDGMWKNNGEEAVPFFIEDGSKAISPTSMYKDNKGILWFGTAADGIYKYDGNSFEKMEFTK